MSSVYGSEGATSSHIRPAADPAASIAARLDRLPATRAVWKLVVLISLGGFFEFYELFATAYIAPGLVHSGILTTTTHNFFGLNGVASFIAASFAGLYIGTFLFGFVADRLGRRTIFTFALLWYSVCAVAMAFQTSASGLNFWRLMTGIGLGIELVTIDCYLSELVPMRIRGRAFALNQVITYSAVPLVACLSWQLIPLTPFGIDGWRWVCALGAVGALPIWLIRVGVPESPRWLMQQGFNEQANQIVAGLEARVAHEHGRQLPAVTVERSIEPTSTRFNTIWSSKYLNRTIMLVLFHIFQSIGLYGFVNWVPTFLINQGVTITTSLGYTLGMAMLFPIGPLIAMLFADRFERKWQIVGSAIVITVAGLIFSQVRGAIPVIAAGAVITLAATVLSFNFHAYQAELYPTSMRARAIGFVYSFSRLSGMLSGFLIAFTLRNHGVDAALMVIAASMAIVALSVGLLGPRTRERTLEAIST
ncbi:MFS transporter [Burkholderia metallica]|uniref:MFS transporter n=1 Tax=Burkholderia metallica TaxID=488729 RepID=UPI00157B3AAF|nr:MFS transporter [Burkholderia metallica]NTZ83624.1 MFS transporter [Burkholderia metallica]